MAEEVLVESKIEDGEKLIQQLRGKLFDVSMACWVQEESGLWYLYLASKDADGLGIADAYKKLNQAIREIADTGIDPFELKLIRTEDPLAKEISELHRRYPARLHTQYRLHELASTTIGEAHIYPPLDPVP